MSNDIHPGVKNTTTGFDASQTIFATTKAVRIWSASLSDNGSNTNGWLYADAVDVQTDGRLNLISTAGAGATYSFPEGLLFPTGISTDLDSNCSYLTLTYTLEG